MLKVCLSLRVILIEFEKGCFLLHYSVNIKNTIRLNLAKRYLLILDQHLVNGEDKRDFVV